MFGQEDRVAQSISTQNGFDSSISLTHDEVHELLDSHDNLEAPELIAAIRKWSRGTKIAAKNVNALDRLCDRLLASVTSAPTLTDIVERLAVIDAKISNPTEAKKTTYATVARSPPEVIPLTSKRPPRLDEVTIEIDRNTEAERKLMGTGEAMKEWVEGAIKDSGVEGLKEVEVAGVKPHRSGTKLTVRLRSSLHAQQVARHANQCTRALGAGAQVSVPHFGVVIQEVPLYYNPEDPGVRQDLFCQSPHLIPSPEAIVDMRWLVPKDRLPKGRRSGSWVVILDSQQAADNLIDQSVKVQALLLGARRYFTGPRQCRRCQQWGHLRHSCRATVPSCAHCADSHESQSCPNSAPTKCANCAGAHAAFAPQCPAKRAENARTQASQAETSVYFAGSSFVFNPFSSSSSSSQ